MITDGTWRRKRELIIAIMRNQLAVDESWLRAIFQRWMNQVHVTQVVDEFDAMPAANASIIHCTFAGAEEPRKCCERLPLQRH